jgi:hypothetical protein
LWPFKSARDEATVWAVKSIGESEVKSPFDESHDFGFRFVFSFEHLRDLIATIVREKLRVAHLGIVAHGDADGQVQLGPDLTPESIAQYSGELADLRCILLPEAYLTFYACIAGRGERGSALLVKLSTELWGRTIVGFELFGYLGPYLSTPGVVQATAYSAGKPDPRDKLGNLDPWGRWAKRARNGKIIHIPELEQKERPGMRCANPNCGGHAKLGDSCKGW